MIFLRFEAEGYSGAYEWGFLVPHGYVPMIGDTVTLVVADPKPEDGDWDEDSEYAIDAVVIKREFSFFTDCISGPEGPQIWLKVELEEMIPRGLVAHSTEWPAFEKKTIG